MSISYHCPNGAVRIGLCLLISRNDSLNPHANVALSYPQVGPLTQRRNCLPENMVGLFGHDLGPLEKDRNLSDLVSKL